MLILIQLMSLKHTP